MKLLRLSMALHSPRPVGSHHMFVPMVMFDEYREPRYAPPPLLKRMVRPGSSVGRAARASTTTPKNEQSVLPHRRAAPRIRIWPGDRPRRSGRWPLTWTRPASILHEQLKLLGQQGLMASHPEAYGGSAAARSPSAWPPRRWRGPAASTSTSSWSRPRGLPDHLRAAARSRSGATAQARLRGDDRGFSLSEPGSGSDASAMTCRACARATATC